MARKLYELARMVPGWIVANLLGFAAISALPVVLTWLKATPGMVVSSLLVGIPIGVAQWIVLRRVVRISMVWVLTIPAGLLLGLAVLNSPILSPLWASFDDESVLALTAGYVVVAALVGLAQWSLLRGHFTRSWAWLLSSVVGLGLGTGLVLGSDLIHQAWLAAVAVVALVYAVVTGPVIAWLRATHGKAEGEVVGAA